MLDIPN